MQVHTHLLREQREEKPLISVLLQKYIHDVDIGDDIPIALSSTALALAFPTEFIDK